MKRLMTLLLCVVLLSACTAQPAASPTAEAVQPTAAAPTETATPAFTATPAPTATPTLTPTPVPAVIDPFNVSKLKLARSSGEGVVAQVVWSPDGKQVLLLTTTHLHLFGAASGEEVWNVEARDVPLTAAFRSDGQMIYTASASGAVQGYGAKTGKLTGTPVQEIDRTDFSGLSQSGKYAAVAASYGGAGLFDLSSGGAPAVINNGQSLPRGMSGILIAPDDKTFLTIGYDSGDNQVAQQWSIPDGKFVRGLHGMRFVSSQFAYSPDASLIGAISRPKISAEKTETSLLVWNALTGDQIQALKVPQDISTYGFLPGGTTAVIGFVDGRLSSWDIKGNTEQVTFAGLKQPSVSIAASLDGKQLAAASTDGVLMIWDAASGKELASAKVEPSLAVMPYELSTGPYITYQMERRLGAAVSPTEAVAARVAPDAHSVELIDLHSMEVLRKVGETDELLTSLAYSLDGKTLAAVAGASKIVLIDVESGKQVKSWETSHKDRIMTLEFSQDGKWLATLSGGTLGELSLWDVEKGEKAQTLAGSYTFDFAPDGKTLASDNIDFGVYVWDVLSGKKLASPGSDWIYDMVYSPDGSRLAVAGVEIHKDLRKHVNLVTLMDMSTYKQTTTEFSGLKGNVRAVRFSPNGKLLAVGDTHGTVTVWDVTSGQQLKAITGVLMYPFDLFFTADGLELVAMNMDGTVRVFETH